MLEEFEECKFHGPILNWAMGKNCPNHPGVTGLRAKASNDGIEDRSGRTTSSVETPTWIVVYPRSKSITTTLVLKFTDHTMLYND